MTVAELIAELSLLPADTRILVSGHEGGYDDPCDPKSIRVFKSCYESTYMGEYEELIDEDSSEEVAASFDAVVIL